MQKQYEEITSWNVNPTARPEGQNGKESHEFLVKLEGEVENSLLSNILKKKKRKRLLGCEQVAYCKQN